jgi:hypothetical protein
MTADLPSLNRHAVVVRPTALFLNWARENPDPLPKLTLDDVRREPTVYLVPEGRNNDDVERFVKQHFSMIFEHELWAWCTEPSLWPENRTYGEFKKWFDVDIHSMVMDLGRDEIEVE